MPEQPAMTRAEARAYDAAAVAAGIPGAVLMDNAAEAAVRVLLALGAVGPIGIVCGKGNNGGDGLVMARKLGERSIPCSVVLAEPPERFAGDAAAAWRSFPAAAAPWSVFDGDEAALAARLRGGDWLVDALLGTGATGAPRPPYDALIRALNAAGRPILAVDLPSGLDADAGEAPGAAVRAAATVTFVAEKRGFANPAAAAFLGKVFVRPILPAEAGR